MVTHPDELIDIVDDQNRVLRQTTKATAHAEGLLHRVIISEVIDAQGRLTLVKQAADRQDPGQFVSPVGGHLRAGESEKDALVRETEEELGFRPQTFFRIGQAIFNRQVIGRQENHFFIVYKIYSDKIPVLNHESVEYKQFTKTELIRLLKGKPELFGAAFFFVARTFYHPLFD